MVDTDAVATAVRERATDAAADIQRVAERQSAQMTSVGRLDIEQSLPARAPLLGEPQRIVAVARVGRPILQSLTPRAVGAPERASSAPRILAGWATSLR